MLALKPSPTTADKKTCTPNLLPCHIHHDGPVDATKRYWDPTRGGDGKLESYFRGRRLQGREVGVPQGYEGKVVREALSGPVGGEEGQKRKDSGARGGGGGGGEEEDDEEEEEEAKVLEDVASFEELVIWGHEALPEGDDPFVKGVEEWVKFAEAASQLFSWELAEPVADFVVDAWIWRTRDSGRESRWERIGMGFEIGMIWE